MTTRRITTALAALIAVAGLTLGTAASCAHHPGTSAAAPIHYVGRNS